MISWRRGLAVLCVVSGLLLIAGNVVWQFNEEAAGRVFNYAADPGVLASLALVTLANVTESLRVRNKDGSHLAQLPRDVITALVAMFAVRLPAAIRAGDASRQRPGRVAVGLPGVHRGGCAGVRGDFALAGRGSGRPGMKKTVYLANPYGFSAQQKSLLLPELVAALEGLGLEVVGAV